MKRVFVSGPLSTGDWMANLRQALDTSDEIVAAGHAPVVPHLSMIQHLVHPQPYETWMAIDFALLETCHGLVRIPGASPGADREVTHADELGIPWLRWGPGDDCYALYDWLADL